MFPFDNIIVEEGAVVHTARQSLGITNAQRFMKNDFLYFCTFLNDWGYLCWKWVDIFILSYIIVVTIEYKQYMYYANF